MHKYVYHKQLLPEVFQNYLTLNKVIHDHNTHEKTDCISFVLVRVSGRDAHPTEQVNAGIICLNT